MQSLPTGTISEAEKEQLMDQLQHQIALSNVQELLERVVEKCFTKCISKPGTSLDGSEQKCVAMCMDRFLESYSLVSKTYSNRIQRQSQNM